MAEMNKAVFLDRDGTINVEKEYLYRIQDFEFIPGVVEGLLKFQNAGYLLIIITNQSGIGRGYYTENDFHILNGWMQEQFRQKGVSITDIYFCPHLPEAKVGKYRMVCRCRKPLLGMFEQAINVYNIDLSRSWTIGDKIRDLSLCEKTFCRGYLVGSSESADIICKVKNGEVRNVSYASSLLEAANNIFEGVDSHIQDRKDIWEY